MKPLLGKDIWFGACEAEGQKVTALRIWRINAGDVNGMTWFDAPYGMTPNGSVNVNPDPNHYSGDERLCGYGKKVSNSDYVAHRRILFGFQQNGTDPGDLEYPTFIIPPKSFFLEGMHMDALPVTGEIPLWAEHDDNGTIMHITDYWQYKFV